MVSLFTPVGLLVQPHAVIALHLSVGPRFLFASGLFAFAVPIALDLILAPTRYLDIGASANVAGTVLTSFFAVRDFCFWLRARF